VRRLLVFASAVVLVETVFFAALAPLLPQFRDDLGLAKWETGLLVASYAIGGVAGAIPAGMLATRFGVKWIVITGLLALSATSALFGVVDAYWALVLTRLAQGFAGTFCWTGALAWVVGASSRERRGEMIGIVMSAAIGGALLGPVVGGLASEVGHFACFGGIACVALGLAAVAAVTTAPARGAPQPLRMLWQALRERQVLAGMWLLTVPALLFGTLSVLGPLRLDELGFGVVGVAGAFFLAGLVEASASPLVGRWSDRSGRLVPMRVGLVASIAVTLVIPWIDGRWALGAAVIVAGLSFGLFWTPSMAMFSDGIEKVGVEHGLGFALMNFGWAPGNALGTAAGGALAGAAGDAVAYGTLAAICAVTLLALRGGQRSPAVATSRA
jgi:MFS family permease